jgi:hypothetical protein
LTVLGSLCALLLVFHNYAADFKAGNDLQRIDGVCGGSSGRLHQTAHLF